MYSHDHSSVTYTLIELYQDFVAPWPDPEPEGPGGAGGYLGGGSACIPFDFLYLVFSLFFFFCSSDTPLPSMIPDFDLLLPILINCTCASQWVDRNIFEEKTWAGFVGKVEWWLRSRCLFCDGE